MFKRYLCQLLVLALLSPAASFALGLGEIHLKSALDAPLDAEIDIVGATPEDLAGLKAQLAPRDAFAHAGLDYPAYFTGLKLTADKASDGRNVLHVRSVDSVTEPFATLLIEADWPRGHVVREYTVLIDPPVFSNTQNPNNAAVASPATGGNARSGNVERADAAASAPAAPAAGAAAATAATSGRSTSARSSGTATGPASGPAGAGGTYTVRHGDTLSAVAAQNYPGSDHSARERQLVGIYRANPSAFEGNMNVLRSGSQLQLPGDAELQAISPSEASSEIHRQYQAWSGGHNGGSGTGQLHLVPPQESGNAAGNAAPSTGSNSAAAGGAAAAAAGATAQATGQNAALSQRVQQLEAQLAEQQRLVQVRNEELAQLQARAGQSKTPPPNSTPANAPLAAAAPPATPTPAQPPPTQSAAPAPANPAPAPAAEPVPVPAATPAPPVVAAQPPASTGTTFLDLLEEYWLWLVLLAVLIVAAIMGLRFVRSRQEEEFDRSLGRLHPAFEGTQTSSGLRSVDTMPVRTLPATAGGEQSYRVEESGTHEQPTAILHDRTGEVPQLTSTEHVVIDDTVTGEHPVGLDQGDPLAEADFHMAYGLYDQAADLVQIAISREPNRRDLRLKLLEVFFVWGNKERFLQTARELASSRDQALPGEWEKVVIMGRQIASEDPLFEGASGLGAAASGGVDLNLEGGQNRVDFDLLGEPTSSHEPGNVGLDLDLGAALGDTQIRNEPDKSGESGVDFVLDDPERGNDATGSTREMPEAPPRPSGATATMQIINSGNAPSDAPTVERQQLEGVENNTIREKLDAATRAGLTSTSDQTAELALDDLGLDLGSLEGAGDETILQGGPDAATMLAGMDEESRRRLSGAADEEDQDRTQVTPTPPPTSESGTWLFTDSDLTDLVPDEERHRFDEDHSGSNPTEVITQLRPPPSIDPGATGRIQALDNSGLDLDLGNLEEHKDADGIDLDVGTPSAGETGTFVQTQRIAQADMPLPELEPATMSEVGTKLDLARAYMDMGDPEGARSILAEVLSEGSVSQKQEARRLMDTLPG
jgi:pilus assembly protein FimV